MTQTTPRRAMLSGALLCAVCVGVYHNALNGPFIFDDVDAIVDNPQIRGLTPLSRFIEGSDLSISGRPVVAFSLALSYALGGLEVSGYHVVNVLLHALSALLLFGLIRRTMRIGGETSDGVALATALLWLVHPLNTEAVNYVVQRTELLMGLFYLLTLYAFVRSVEPGTGRTGRRLFQGLMVVSCALGMASKEVMVTCPVVVLVFDWIFVAGSLRQALRSRWPAHLALAMTWAVLVALVIQLPRAGSTGYTHGSFGVWDYLLTQISAVVAYLRLSIWPDPRLMIIDYGDWMTHTPALPAPGLAAVVLLPLAVASIVGLIRKPSLGFLGFWFFGLLAPTSSVVPILTEIAAERRTYLSLVAVILLAVLAGRHIVRAVCRWKSWDAAGLACSLAVAAGVVVLGGLTLHRNALYQDEVSLWDDAVRKVPQNPRALEWLGAAHLRKGDLDDAVVFLRRSIAIRPSSHTAHNILGTALAGQNKPGLAARQLRIALRLNPKDAVTHNNMGNLLAQRGDPLAAIKHYRVALRLKPHFTEARMNLGKALKLAGRSVEAVAQYKQVLAAEPSNVRALHALANLQLHLGRTEQAFAAYRRAMGLGGETTVLLNDYGVALARSGRLEQAVSVFRGALRRHPRHKQTHRNLGLALMRLGRVAEGRRHLSLAGIGPTGPHR